MQLFLENPEKRYYVRELTRITGALINSVRRELNNLVELQLILTEAEQKKNKLEKEEGESESEKPAAGPKKSFNAKKYYYLNPKNIFHQDLLNLFAKGKVLVERKYVEKIKRYGDVKYLALSGVFVEDERANTDLLIIGKKLKKDRIGEVLAELEQESNKAIRYTILDNVEYQLRKDIEDRFLMDILENEKNIIVVDKMKELREDE